VHVSVQGDVLPKGYNNRNRLAQELLALVLRKLLIFPQYRVDARQHSRPSRTHALERGLSRRLRRRSERLAKGLTQLAAASQPRCAVVNTQFCVR
jgi:hypothetical protein